MKLLFVLILCVFSIRADTLISGASPGENPLQNQFMFGTLTQNPNGTQTLSNPPTVGTWVVGVIFPKPPDLFQSGQNKFIALRAKYEPGNLQVANIDIGIYGNTGRFSVTDSIHTTIPGDSFKVGEFSTIYVPFSQFQHHPGYTTESVLRDVTRVALISNVGLGRNVLLMTFDAWYATPVPEPTTFTILGAAAVFWWLVCSRGRAG